MSSYYWSGTTNANNTNNAWNINFNNGNDNNNNKSYSRYVRAVRAGKCSLLSFESVFNAYMDCKKRKSCTINALRFQYDLIAELVGLSLALQKGTYQPSRSVCFLTNTPKLREVFAADFRDRVIHHLIVRELEKIYEPCFIHDSYACRKGRGIHEAVARLQSFMGKETRNHNRRAWYMQLDIRSFFMSIDKEILFELLMKKLKSAASVPGSLSQAYQGKQTTDCIEMNGEFEALVEADALLWLCSIILFHDCTEDYHFKGDPSQLKYVPEHKSLFRTDKSKGIPIGNLTSQFFANVYLNELDQFVKHKLRCRWYIRYVDDFVLIHPDRETLEKWRDDIIDFLSENLKLSLKNIGKIARVTEGVNFLGYITRPRYRLTRNRVVNNLKYKLNLFKNKMIHSRKYGERTVMVIVLKPDVVSDLRQILASYLGHFKHSNSWKLIHSIFTIHGWLNFIFDFDGDNYRLIERLKYKKNFRTYRAQVAFFKSRFNEGWIHLFHVGKYFEAYGEDARLLKKTLGYRIKNHRKGLNPCTGFPTDLQDLVIPKMVKAGLGNIVMMEEESRGKFIHNRRISHIISPSPVMGQGGNRVRRQESHHEKNPITHKPFSFYHSESLPMPPPIRTTATVPSQIRKPVLCGSRPQADT